MKNHPLTLSNEQLIQRILSLEAQLSEQKSVLDDNEKILQINQKSLKDANKVLLKKDAQLTKKSDKIATLEEYIRYMTQQRFGASSEKWSPDQLGLFDEAEILSDEDDAQESTTLVPAHQRKKKRLSIPDDLPVTDIIHDLPEDEKFCPHDNQALKHFSDECHKQLDYIPAKVTVLNHVRRKYRCPCCNDYFVTAKKPAQPIEKSIASPGLLSQIATHKYCDGLPLYRQSNLIFKRLGVELDSTSMANWMIKCGQLVQPLINLGLDVLRAQDVLFMDETVTQVLKEEERRASQQSRMWIMTNNTDQRMVLFHYSPTRETSVAALMLGDFSGTLMTDGYAVYDAVAKTNGLTHLGCWAHARRYFKEASDAQPKGTSGKPEQALSYIQKLFRIEAGIKAVTTDEKYAVRQKESVPILAALKKWLDKSLKHPVKSAKLSKALTYLSNQWYKLSRYTQNGAWPMDNNHAENCIRPFVIGRKNWLFSTSVEGAKASANLYSLVESAKANNLEPSAYLKIVFTLLPQAKTVEEVEALLPWNINKAVG
jgi:transposase